MGAAEHIHKALPLSRSGNTSRVKAARRLERVYSRNVLAFYRAVRAWLRMTRKALQYGVEMQMVRGLEPQLDGAREWPRYAPPAKMIDRLLHDHRVTKTAERLGKAGQIEQFSDVTTQLAEAKAATMADWGCIRYHGDKQLFQNHLRVYGQAMGQAAQIARASTTWDVVNRQAVDWALERSNALVTLVSEETRAALREVIGRGIEQGKTMAQIGGEIKPLVGLNARQAAAMEKYRADVEKLHGAGSKKANKLIALEAERKHNYRAEMIARTETARSVSEGTLAGYKEADVKEIRFEASLDACDICAGYDGNKYLVGEAEGMLPIHPNCRCVFSPVTAATEQYRAEEAGVELPEVQNDVQDTLRALSEEQLSAITSGIVGEEAPWGSGKETFYKIGPDRTVLVNREGIAYDPKVEAGLQREVLAEARSVIADKQNTTWLMKDFSMDLGEVRGLQAGQYVGRQNTVFTVVTNNARDAGAGSAGRGVPGMKVFQAPYSNKAEFQRAFGKVRYDYGIDPMAVTAHEFHHAIGSGSEFDYFSQAVAARVHLRHGLALDHTKAMGPYLDKVFGTSTWKASGNLARPVQSARGAMAYLLREEPKEVRRLLQKQWGSIPQWAEDWMQKLVGAKDPAKAVFRSTL